jgi:prolipoprotein diacylglyceryl transferase
VTWNPDPVLVDLGFAEIRWYGLFFAGGVLLAALSLSRDLLARGVTRDDATSLSIWLLVGLVLGAHFGHLLFYEPESIWKDPIRIVQFGLGLASHGGIAGGIVALLIWCRRRRVGAWPFADSLATSAVWIIPCVRIGNFFNSEIVGDPTDLPWGVVFAGNGEAFARHPAQLYEALAGLVLIAVALELRRRRDRLAPGVAFCLMLLLYGAARFAIEFVKPKQILPGDWPLTMGQLLSIAFIAAGALGLWLRSRVPRPDPRTEPGQ